MLWQTHLLLLTFANFPEKHALRCPFPKEGGALSLGPTWKFRCLLSKSCLTACWPALFPFRDFNMGFIWYQYNSIMTNHFGLSFLFQLLLLIQECSMNLPKQMRYVKFVFSSNINTEMVHCNK